MSNFQSNLDRLRSDCASLEIITEGEALSDKSHDWWVRGRLQRKAGQASVCGAVVRPVDTGEVSAVLSWADDTGTAIVPFGLGSGVCGAVQTTQDLSP